MKELVSVIIPVYNVEDYLEDCIKSVINQTYQYIEIILIDDGSTDKSSEICDKFALQDNRIRIIHQDNKGLSAARNAGIDMCSGKYITFVDSDDFIDLTMIEKLVEVAVKDGFSMCEKNLYTQNGEKSGINVKNKGKLQIKKHSYYKKMRNNPDYVVVWGKLFDRKLFENIRFWEGIQNEDEDIMPQLVFCAKKIIKICAPLYNYRIRENSIMHSDFSLNKLDVIKVCQKRIERYKEWNLKGMYKWAVKDYYIHLLKLKKEINEKNNPYEYKLVQDKIIEWNMYKIKFNFFESMRLKNVLGAKK